MAVFDRTFRDAVGTFKARFFGPSGATETALPMQAIALDVDTPVSETDRFPVEVPASELHLGEVGGNTAIVTNNFTRPSNTTPYASGDLIANSTTAGLVTPIILTVARKNAGTGRYLRLRLAKSSASLTNASFRVHLFRDAPTTTAGDNEAFSAAVNGLAKLYIGYVDITMSVAFSDGAMGFGAADLGPCLSFSTAAGSQANYALIEARGAYAGESAETFTIYAEVDRD